MIAKRILGEQGRMVLDDKHPCPFEAENDFEEALLYFLRDINNAVQDMEAATTGEIDNPVEIRLYALEAMITRKLDAVIDELRLLRQVANMNEQKGDHHATHVS